MGKHGKMFSAVSAILLLFVALFGTFLISPTIVMLVHANPGDVPESWYNDTTLNVTVLWKEPRINFYDFQYNQSGTWVSRLNQQIDVNASAEYRFIVNVSSDQGWEDVEYINISAWYDQGDDTTVYNQTLGGNFNLQFQYENTSGTAAMTMQWPTNGEVVAGDFVETISHDPYGSPVFTDCRVLSFSFIPGYQFRYAPGDGTWNKTMNVTDDLESWNFLITTDDGGNMSSVKDEFGVYSYSEIVSAGWPTIYGNPGENATASSNITILTRSNGNYSLSVDIDNLTHRTHPTANMLRSSVWLRGGDVESSLNFPSPSGLIYLYGGEGAFHFARENGTDIASDDVEYKCDIPFGQIAGEYVAAIRYHLMTV
jgi:hypothetical protein